MIILMKILLLLVQELIQLQLLFKDDLIKHLFLLSI